MAQKNVTRDMTQGSPLKLILTFSLPLLGGFLFQQLYSFMDTMVVGGVLGTEALAAVGDTGSLNFLINGFCMGICSGFAIPIAQAFGAKDETEMRRYVMHSVYLCAVISVLMGLLTGFFAPQLLRILCIFVHLFTPLNRPAQAPRRDFCDPLYHTDFGSILQGDFQIIPPISALVLPGG